VYTYTTNKAREEPRRARRLQLIASSARLVPPPCCDRPEVVRQLLSRRRADAPMARLTSREHEVLGLMAQGLTNGSIAQRLFVREAAVRKHVGSIFAKLDLDPGSDRRVSAVLAYLRG
jgi:DNA-binding NarL/FixJ family response regulator